LKVSFIGLLIWFHVASLACNFEREPKLEDVATGHSTTYSQLMVVELKLANNNASESIIQSGFLDGYTYVVCWLN